MKERGEGPPRDFQPPDDCEIRIRPHPSLSLLRFYAIHKGMCRISSSSETKIKKCDRKKNDRERGHDRTETKEKGKGWRKTRLVTAQNWTTLRKIQNEEVDTDE